MINYVYQLVSPRIFNIKYEDIDFNNKVIIKPNYLAICHADQRYYLGQREPSVLNKKLPMALIHEGCGIVVKDPTGTYQVGQKVVMIPNAIEKVDGVIYENYDKSAYFLSSGHDGFMRELVDLPVDRIVPYNNVDDRIVAISEFVSVAVHSVTRFKEIAHSIRDTITIWGDGSLSYTVACILKLECPYSKIVVIGRNPEKLSQFMFVDNTYLVNEIPEDFRTDHAFECCGGEGSAFAIDDAIKYINPQGTIMLMGVSENKIPVYTRNVLEKGITIVGCSRSGRKDFEKVIKYMEETDLAERLRKIVYLDDDVKSIKDINRVFANDLNTTFKTVFKWDM